MRLLRYILIIIVWTTLGLYLTFILTFKIPAVQQYFGSQIANAIAQKLGTHVSIGRADFDIPNHLTLYDVLIKDQQGKDMLVSRRLSAKIDLIPLAEGKISIATAQIFGTTLQLYQQHAHSKPNFQFALDSLASKDTTSTTPLDLRINSLIMRQTQVSFDRHDQEETPGTLNPNHLKFSDISAHIILKALTADSLNVNIKRLALKEQSGLKIDRLTMRFEGNKSQSHLTDFLLRMPNTELKLGDIQAHYQFSGTQLVEQALSYEGSIKESTITPSDLSCFLPSLEKFKNPITLSSSIQGQGSDLLVSSLMLSSEKGDIELSARGWVKELSSDTPAWYADISDLRLSTEASGLISKSMSEEPLPILSKLGNIHMKGFVKGEGIQEIETNSVLNTEAGSVTVQMALTPQHTFSGSIDTEGINLHQLLDNEHLGVIATKVDMSGELASNHLQSINAIGLIKQFDYNGYQFQNIDVNASYQPNAINGQLHIDDPHLQLSINGDLLRQGSSNEVNMTASIRNFSPQAVNLTSKWGDARFSSNLHAQFKASSLNDAIGTLDMTDFKMESNEQTYQLQGLHVSSGYDEGRHYMTLDSDFANASIKGNFDYGTLMHSITNLIAEKLPTLPGLPPVNPQADNDFTLHATVYKSDWLQQLLQIPIRLSQPLVVEGTVNDREHQLSLDCDIPQFFYKDSQYDLCHISILTPLRTLLCELNVTKLMDDGKQMKVQLTGSAYNNQLSSSLVWDDHSANRMSGKITGMANFISTLDGRQITDISIAPSTMTVKGTAWDILPCHITYYDNHLDIDKFTIRHGQQHLLLDGTASKSNADSIKVNLREVDVDYVLGLVNFHAVDFSGLASGSGSISGLFGNMEAHADLTVDQFKFENGRMGTLDAQVRWNSPLKQIDIHGICDDGADAMTYIDGYVSPDRNSINLGIRAEGTHLDFALSFTSSFISDINGHANGAVRLAGPLDAINLTGQLVLNGSAHVKTLGCTYELRSDTLRMVPNEIEFAHCPIYDINGNRGILTGGIHHQELTNLTYDIYVDADNLMAYDFPDFGDELFYGTVYAQGTAAIHGRENEVVIEADVTPLKNSVFVYNAASPDVITDQEFIRWNTQNAPSIQHMHNEQSDFRSDLTMRLKINTTPNAAIRLLMDPATGDYITLRGNGDLQATYYNKGGFTMFGNYQVSNGTYEVTIQNIIKKNFTFKEGGTIVFGGDPYDAQLDLQAQHIVNGVSLSDLNVGRSFSNTVRVNCLMNITGQPRSPIVDFDLDILNVNTDEKQMVRSIINGQEEMRQQVVYLLAVGRFYPQGANNANEVENQRNNTSLAMQSLLSGTLSGQINSMLGQLIKSNNWNFGANISTGDEGWNNAEYEGLISGRLLNNRLLINGQFGYRDNATTATPSFIGDFDISYLLYPSGNLALKVYNQTNDRYFTRSSLNTQGIGIIMRKDFNGWRELLRNRKTKRTKNVK